MFLNELLINLGPVPTENWFTTPNPHGKSRLEFLSNLGGKDRTGEKNLQTKVGGDQFV